MAATHVQPEHDAMDAPSCTVVLAAGVNSRPVDGVTSVPPTTDAPEEYPDVKITQSPKTPTRPQVLPCADMHAGVGAGLPSIGVMVDVPDTGVPSAAYTIVVSTNHSRGRSPVVRMTLKSSTDETKEFELPTRGSSDFCNNLFCSGVHDTFLVTMPYVSDINAITVSVEAKATPSPTAGCSAVPADQSDTVIYVQFHRHNFSMPISVVNRGILVLHVWPWRTHCTLSLRTTS